MVEVMKINPNIRLLKMLGEDLIKDEKTAVIELVKNSYDADATNVRIFFNNFSANFEACNNSEIIIVDNGNGMSKEEIENNWLIPGTANKKEKKLAGEKTKLGRVYQGEKGIGRYSMLKLARSVEVFSKIEDEFNWNHAKIDLSVYDENYFAISKESKNMLGELDIIYDNQKFNDPNVNPFIGDKGTIIHLSNLNSNWNSKKVSDIYNDLARLEPISNIIHGWKSNQDIDFYFENFNVEFYLNGIETFHRVNFLDDLTKFLNLQKNKCILSIKNGHFNSETGVFDFDVNDKKHIVNVNDNSFNKMVAYKRYFVNERDNFSIEDLKCGPFNFEFYIFHFNNREKYLEKYKLTDTEKELVENHRIYLYRDNTRVYPYGEKKNDWLSIDALRGLTRANEFLTNGQIVGFISISYDKNPKLQDKSNREGLIEEDEITFEFIALIQSLLNYIRKKIYNDEIAGIKNNEKMNELLEQEEYKRLEKLRKQQEEEERKRLEELRNQQEEKNRLEELRKQQEEEAYNRKKIEEIEKAKRELKEKQLLLEKKEAEIKKKELQSEEEVRKELAEKIRTQIIMNNGDEGFFSCSDVIKASSLGEKIPMEYNSLLNQILQLKYEDFFLLYGMVFRALVEDVTKKYNLARGIQYRKALGEKVNLMVQDMLELVKDKHELLTTEQKNELEAFLGGKELFKSELNIISSEFYKDGKQGMLATKLNSLTHNPKFIEKNEALSIANNNILPLIIISQKIIKFIDINKQ